jgi:ABC-2 type transport system ATP-binding protein
LCDRIGVIHKGRMVAQGTIDSLRAGSELGESLETVFLRIVGAGDAAGSQLEWLGG